MILHAHFYPREPSASADSRTRIILLHGLGGTGSLWRPLAASLEDHYDLLCPDQRGHGESIPPSSDWVFTPDAYGRDVRDTAVHHHFVPSWALGHSMGVRTVLGYAKLFPQEVLGLVLIDLGFSGLAGGGLGEGLASFLRILPETFPSRAEARDFITKNCPDPSIGQYLMAVSRVAADGSVSFPFNHDALLRTVEGARGVESFAALEAFARDTGRPVYVLRGERSLVYTREEFERDRARAAHLPNVKFIEFAGASHGLPFEKRLDLVAKIREWVG